MNLIDKDALIESLGIETDCYDCEHETIIYHCDLDPVIVCEKIIQAPVISVTTESAEKAIEVLKNAAWLGAVYSFEETEEAVKTAIRALQIVSDHFADVCENTCDFTRKSNDNISRADVCEILSDMYPTDGEKVVRTKCIDTAYDAVLRLPTIQPNVHDFPKDADCISRQAAIKELESGKDKKAKGEIGGFYNQIIENDIEKLRKLPSAQLKTGKWIDKSGGIEDAWNYCSVCGEQAIDLYDFCPNCGADMRGEKDE